MAGGVEFHADRVEMWGEANGKPRRSERDRQPGGLGHSDSSQDTRGNGSRGPPQVFLQDLKYRGD